MDVKGAKLGKCATWSLVTSKIIGWMNSGFDDAFDKFSPSCSFLTPENTWTPISDSLFDSANPNPVEQPVITTAKFPCFSFGNL